MMNDKSQHNDELLDRMIAAALERPIPEAPPDDIRQRVLALADRAMSTIPKTNLAVRSHAGEYGRLAMSAIAVLVAVDLGWWLAVESATPVCWFRPTDEQTWRIMFDNSRVTVTDA